MSTDTTAISAWIDERRTFSSRSVALSAHEYNALLDCVEALMMYEDHFGDPLKVIRPALARLMELR